MSVVGYGHQQRYHHSDNNKTVNIKFSVLEAI